MTINNEFKCVDCGKVITGGLDTFGPIDELRCWEHYMEYLQKLPFKCISLVKIVSDGQESE